MRAMKLLRLLSDRSKARRVLRMFLKITAPHGSTRVGLRRIARTTSMHLIALVEDQTEDKIQERRPPTVRAEGMVNWEVSNILGMTIAATAWVRAFWSA